MSAKNMERTLSGCGSAGSQAILAVMTDAAANPRLEHLAHDLERFRAFVRGRVRDPHLADEILHDAFARAARAIDQLQDDDRLDAWFYRILRNRIADSASHGPAVEQLTHDPIASSSDEHTICQCLAPLIERLPSENALALRRVDIERVPSEDAAQQLGITVNALNVRRHRGRQQLRVLLDAACGMCAHDGCRDCQCS